MINGFSKALQMKKARGTDYTMVHNFLGAMQNPIRTNQLWSHCDDNEIEDALDALERKILGDERVGKCILSNMGENWSELDGVLEKRMWCLQFVQPQVPPRHLPCLPARITLGLRVLSHVGSSQHPCACILTVTTDWLLCDSQHLDIKRSHAIHPALTLARKMLVRLNDAHAPQEKLECIFRYAK
jgi:hypothetical protein